MLAKKIASFPGVNTNSVNWMKHYLNGGDDVGAPWNGIADSVSGYTYKYSNQFEFDFKYSDFSKTNLVCNVFRIDSGAEQIAVPTLLKVEPNLSGTPEVTVYRLPFPDLPGMIVVKQSLNIPLPNLEPGPQYPGYVVPIYDPNWLADSFMIDSRSNQGYLNRCYASIKRGFSSELTAFRLAGASLTLNCSAPILNINGTLVAGQATIPYALGGMAEAWLHRSIYESGTTSAQNDSGTTMQSFGMPIGYSDITSVKSYHKFQMQEGTYVVLHNTQGSFLFMNYEDTIQPFEFTNNTAIDLRQYYPQVMAFYDQSGWPEYYPILHMKNKANHDWISDGYAPYFRIPYTQLTEWNTAFVAPSILPTDDSFIFTAKLNTYAECYVANTSSLKPSVSMTSIYYPRLLEYLSGFYHEFDGIYPSAWNDGKKVWNKFVGFLTSPAVEKAVSVIDPGLGAAVGLGQSLLERINNKENDGQKKKLTKIEKQKIKKEVATLLGEQPKGRDQFISLPKRTRRQRPWNRGRGGATRKVTTQGGRQQITIKSG